MKKRLVQKAKRKRNKRWLLKNGRGVYGVVFWQVTYEIGKSSVQVEDANFASFLSLWFAKRGCRLVGNWILNE